MTAQEYYKAYKGRRVRVNENYYAVVEGRVGRYGIVYGVHFNFNYVVVHLDSYHGNTETAWIEPHALDLVDEPCSKIVPLPLPG